MMSQKEIKRKELDSLKIGEFAYIKKYRKTFNSEYYKYKVTFNDKKTTVFTRVRGKNNIVDNRLKFKVIKNTQIDRYIERVRLARLVDNPLYRSLND